MSVLFGGRPCVDPAALHRASLDASLPTDWAGKANRFDSPLGRGPGAGAVLLTKADLDDLDLDADHTLSFRDDRTPNRPIDLPRITLLRFKCLTPGYRDDERAVYLCDLVDRRHFLTQTPVDRAYNVRDADGTGYLSATTNGGTAWTWAEVVEDLWAELDAGTVPALPFTPDGEPENLRYHAGWAWEAVNNVLDRIACAVRYDPVADTFSIVRLGDTAAAGAAALTATLARHDRAGLRTWDAYHGESARGRLPEKVRVLFQRRPVPTDGSSPWYAEDVTLTATAGVAAGTVVQLHDDLTAVGTGTPTNAAALTTRAEERAEDWRRKRIGYERRLTLVYRDFRPDLTAGETVERTALDDHGGPMVTVLESAPDGALERWRPSMPPLGSELVTETTECTSDLDALRKSDCITVSGDADTTGAWNDAAGGWLFDGTVETGDGEAVGTLVEVEYNQQLVRLVGETQTWYLSPRGCSARGTLFRGRYKPLELEPEPGDGSGGSGSGDEEPCTGEVLELWIKCGCGIFCGTIGPLPRTMCVATSPTTTSPDPDPDPEKACSFFYGMVFEPVTVAYRAAPDAWGTAGTDFPATINGGGAVQNLSGTAAFPTSGAARRWFGKGTLTHPTGTYSYGVEVWLEDDGCHPNVTYYLPQIETFVVGAGGPYQIVLRSYTLPFGTPPTFPELPAAGSFPIAVPSNSVLPTRTGADNSGDDEDPCPNGVIFPVDFPSVARWSYGSTGTFALGPATIYENCVDIPPGGEAVCDAPACTGGASRDYTFPITGGTDDWDGANGDWAVSHAGGNTWVGVLGAWTATLVASVTAGLSTITLNGPDGQVLTYGMGAPFGCCEASSFLIQGGVGGLGMLPGNFTVEPAGECECPP